MGRHADPTRDEWQRRATAAAIAAARAVVLGDEAAIPTTRRSAGSRDIEWGWIVAAVIFAWISTRAEQATAEGLDVEQAVRIDAASTRTRGTPAPWRRSCRSSADAPGVDWSKPLDRLAARRP